MKTTFIKPRALSRKKLNQLADLKRRAEAPRAFGQQLADYNEAGLRVAYPQTHRHWWGRLWGDK